MDSSLIATILAFSDVNTLLIGLCVFLLLRLLHQSTTTRDTTSPDGFYGYKVIYLFPSALIDGLLKGLYFHELLIKWGKRFNGMFSICFPGIRLLVINDFEALKEAFKHPDLNDRAPNQMRDFLFRGKGKRKPGNETYKQSPHTPHTPTHPGPHTPRLTTGAHSLATMAVGFRSFIVHKYV